MLDSHRHQLRACGGGGNPPDGGSGKLYDVIIAGVETTLQLSDDDALRLQLTPRDEKAAVKPANKARVPRNKVRQ